MMERRFVKGAEVRAASNGHIEGHAAVFNEQYVLCDYPDFKVVETIKSGAFSRAISEQQDVRCLFNHEPDNLLGRTKAGTLTIREDSKGLAFDCDPPDTQLGRDLRTLIQRKDITGCSFAFSVKKQTRTEEETDGKVTVTRTIEDVDLFDVGAVTYPAYSGTDVQARAVAVELRGVFPDGVPEKLRAHVQEVLEEPTSVVPSTATRADDSDEDDMGECACRCEACSKCSERSADPAAEGTSSMKQQAEAILREQLDNKPAVGVSMDLARARTRNAEVAI